MQVGLAGPVDIHPLQRWLEARPDDIPPGLGGSPVTQLAEGLLRTGHDVKIFTLDRVDREVVLKGSRLAVHVAPWRQRRRARDAFRHERRWLERMIAREQPTFVHAHWTYEYALAALATSVPTLITVHDWAPAITRMQPDPYRFVRLGMNAAALLRGRRLTTVSPYMRERLQRWLRRDAELIPNAVDDRFFTERRNPPNTAAPLLMAVNMDFEKRKNVSTLLSAFASILARWPAARLRLVGRQFGPGGAAQAWARQRGLDVQVEFAGPLPQADVTRLMREADVFVHPSLEESFGMVLIEAMAQGLPVVAGRDSGAVPWVLANGQAGLLTDVRSPHALAAAISSLLDEPERWEQFSRAGYAHVDRHYRLSVVVERYVEVYRRLLTQR